MSSNTGGNGSIQTKICGACFDTDNRDAQIVRALVLAAAGRTHWSDACTLPRMEKVFE